MQTDNEDDGHLQLQDYKQGTRENVLIGQTLTVRQTRMCNNHRRKGNAQHLSNENDLNDRTDEEILVFIRRELDELKLLNCSAGILHLQGSHIDAQG